MMSKAMATTEDLPLSVDLYFQRFPLSLALNRTYILVLGCSQKHGSDLLHEYTSTNTFLFMFVWI